MITPTTRFHLVRFDRSIIRSNWNRLAKQPMARQGMLVRRIARSSIRTARGKKAKTRLKPSKPGRPPKSRSDRKEMKMIFSVPQDPFSVIVGPVGFGPGDPVPAVHEHGLSVVRSVWAVHGGQAGTDRLDRFRARRRRKGRRRRKPVRYPSRPFMRPAMEKAIDKYPLQFKEVLR
jgi:hypothetical protein